MSQTHGLILESGYRPPALTTREVAERSFPWWTVVFVLLALVATFAPSVAVTLVADLRATSPATCEGDGVGDVDGLAASAAARRSTTEAVVAGGAPGEGRC